RVSAEHALGEPAEQAHHREIDLAVATVRGRIDEARRAVVADVQIAAPQVAVQARGRLRGTRDVGKAREETVEAAAMRGRETPGVVREAELRLEAFGAKKLRPRRVHAVRLREATDEVVVVEPEGRGRRAVQGRERPAEDLVEITPLRPGFD